MFSFLTFVVVVLISSTVDLSISAAVSENTTSFNATSDSAAAPPSISARSNVAGFVNGTAALAASVIGAKINQTTAIANATGQLVGGLVNATTNKLGGVVNATEAAAGGVLLFVVDLVENIAASLASFG